MAGFKAASVFLVLAVLHGTFGDKLRKNHQASSTGNGHDKPTEGYDKRMAPKDPLGGPVKVDISIFVRDLHLYPKKMEMGSTITLRMNWTDPRLNYSATKEAAEIMPDSSKMWIPDMFVQNERTGHLHHLMTPNVLVKVSPSGQVFYSTRVTLTTSCPMSFRWFPFDSQRCDLKLASYGHSTKDILLAWKHEGPVALTSSLTVANFMVTSVEVSDALSVTSSGNYTSLIATLSFSRDYHGHVWHFFIPTMLALLLSWVAFWLHPSAVTPRILLGLGAVYAIYHLHTGSGQEPSVVSYLSAFDVWGLMLTLSAVFGILETATVSFVRYQTMEHVAGPTHVVTEETVYGHPDHPAAPLMGKTITTTSRFPPRFDTRLDAISRIAFPLVFLIFAVVYWAVCLTHS